MDKGDIRISNFLTDAPMPIYNNTHYAAMHRRIPSHRKKCNWTGIVNRLIYYMTWYFSIFIPRNDQ